ncbi:spore germination protein [Neobacillus kokaensis]|uniref:Uncharacterized protein n=1 Tax=Neobacillus kokaensis TaxID=2759023 RepID=A0ABQ3MVJ9_9BACI|nr:spore germination protein [Neobacillus kokaensis]GHH96704.1 hypothetical protein AM1BK_02470 [Neobacillus kokaensis]
MPVIIGPLEILNVTDGILNIGDAAFTTPKLTSKTFAGSGVINTGGVVFSNTVASGTNIFDPDVADQPKSGNN